MFTQKRLQVLLIDVAIFPIIDRFECFLDAETFSRIHLLFQFFRHTVERYFSAIVKS